MLDTLIYAEKAIGSTFNEVKILFQNQHWRKASSALTTCLKEQSDKATILALLGYVRYQQSRYDEAVKALEQAVSSRNVEPITILYLVKSLQAQGELISAYALLQDHQGILETCSETKNLCEFHKSNVDLLNHYDVNINAPKQEIAKDLYLIANQLFHENKVEEASLCYDTVGALQPRYDIEEFNIGSTIPTYHSLSPKGEFLGCHWLLQGINFHEKWLRFCCTYHSGNKGWTKISNYQHGALPIDAVLAKRLLILDQLSNDIPNGCSGCYRLEKKNWDESTHLLSELVVNSYSVCNFRCSYCSLTHKNFEMPAYYYDMDGIFKELVEYQYIAPQSKVSWGGGDPCVSREFPAISRKLLDLNCITHVNTNASIFIPEIAEGLSRGLCNVAISVDAGSKKTFYKVKMNRKEDSNTPILIKNEELFETVWKNIGKYAALSSDKVSIKYIFLDDNATHEEVELFLQHCLCNNVTRVSFTPEQELMKSLPLTKDSLPTHIYNAMKYAAHRATELGFNFSYSPAFPENVFSPSLTTQQQNLPE